MNDIHSRSTSRNPDKLRRLYEKSDIYHYWIIDKRGGPEYTTMDNTSVWEKAPGVPIRRIKQRWVSHGPLSREAYLGTRQELGIPDSLKLLEMDRRFVGPPLKRLWYKIFRTSHERVVE